MYKIGEFSKLGQVSTRMLRHYDKLGLLTPSHTDEWTGYRYYTVDQLARLNRIIALKELGFSLEQVAELLDEGTALDARQMRGMLRMRQAELAQELRNKEMQLARVEARLRQIEQEGRPSPYEVVVKPLPAQAVASMRQMVERVEEVGHYCQVIYGRLYRDLRRRGIQPQAPEIALYHNDEYTETNLDVELAVAVAPRVLDAPPQAEHITFHWLPPVELAAALIYEGPFSELTDGVLALLNYVATHNHVLVGPLRELHLSGPAHGPNAPDATPVVELQVPIRAAG